MSVALQIMLILQFLAFSSALETGMTLSDLAILVPIVMLVTLLPFTINGIGLRETALTLVGATFGLTATYAIAMAWLFLGVNLIYAIIGGLIYMRGRR